MVTFLVWHPFLELEIELLILMALSWHQTYCITSRCSGESHAHGEQAQGGLNLGDHSMEAHKNWALDIGDDVSGYA